MFIRWNPYRELRQLHHLQRQMNNLFENQLEQDDQAVTPTCDWRPAVDVYEDVEHFVLTAELPGVEPSQVDLRVEQNQLTVKGERKLEREEKKDNYLRLERCYGTFARTFTLPESVDTTKIAAEYKNGLLHISIPKRSEVMPKQITVKISS